MEAATLTEHERRSPRRRRSGPARWRLLVVAATCAASAVGVAVAHPEPTGSTVPDVAWALALGAIVPLAASRARRWSLLILAGVTAIAAQSFREHVVSLAALALAMVETVLDRRERLLGAVIGAATIQVLVRLPEIGFHGGTTLITAVAVAPVLVSGWRATRRRWRRPLLLGAAVVGGFALLATFVFGVTGLSVRSDLQRGIDLSNEGLDAARAGDDATARDRFARAADALATADGRLNAWWLAPTRAVPVIAQHQVALGRAAGASADLAATAAAASDALQVDALRPTDGRIDPAAVRALEAPLLDSVTALEAATQELQGIDSPWLLAPVNDRLDELRTRVDDALPDARTAVDGSRVVPGMLGADGPRRWLLVFTSPAESRLTGGFAGDWAVLEMDDGAFRVVENGRSADLNNAEGADTRRVSATEEYRTRYGRYSPDVYFQNVTASPHFPWSAEVAATFYEGSVGGEIDGVIALDPYAVTALVDLLGPVELGVPEVPGALDGDALLDLLLVGQYRFDEATQSAIGEAAVEAVSARFTSGSLPGPTALADALSAAVAQERLLVWSERPDEQAFLEQIRVAGVLPEPDGGDLTLVGVANAGPTKLDTYLERDITQRVTYDPASGGTTSVVTATLRNTASASLPDAAVIPNPDFPRGTNRLFVWLYSPLTIETLSVDGEPSALEVQQERGWFTYGRLVDVPPGGEVELRWTLYGQLDPGGYRLRWEEQPLVRPATLDLQVTTAGVPWAEAQGLQLTDGGVATYEGPVTRDLTVTVTPAES